jgi:hypothetical protein
MTGSTSPLCTIQPIDSLILIVAATTGEGLTPGEAETERLVQIAAAKVRPALKLYFGVIRDRLLRGDQSGAQTAWQRLVDLPRVLCAEPSPAPIQHWL